MSDVTAKFRELVVRFGRDPRSAIVQLELAVGLLRAPIVLRGCVLGSRVSTVGPVTTRIEGLVRLGDRVIFGPAVIASEIVCHRGGTLEIGEDTGFNGGVSLEAMESVRIGRRCRFGAMVRVSDRGVLGTAPVLIGDDVWIAHGAIIESGVTIGDGAAVSAGSVVTRPVPAGHLAIGNPARVVRLDLIPDSVRR